jgi:hypothetical protein
VKEKTDRVRCIFFSKLIQSYAESLLEKANLITQYALILDCSYCLQAGISQPGCSPIGDEFMSKLLKLWQQFG